MLESVRIKYYFRFYDEKETKKKNQRKKNIFLETRRSSFFFIFSLSTQIELNNNPLCGRTVRTVKVKEFVRITFQNAYFIN